MRRVWPVRTRKSCVVPGSTEPAGVCYARRAAHPAAAAADRALGPTVRHRGVGRTRRARRRPKRMAISDTQRELSYRKRLIEIANLINSAPEHPGDPGRPQGPDARSGRRRARDDLRARHQEPGAVLAVQGRAGGARDPRSEELHLDRGLHRALAQDGQHRRRLRRLGARAPTIRTCASTCAGTRAPASRRPSCCRHRSSTTSTCSACCSSSTSAAAAASPPATSRPRRSWPRSSGSPSTTSTAPPARNKPSKFGALVDKGLDLREGHREGDLGRARQPDGRRQDPAGGVPDPEGRDPPGDRALLRLRRLGAHAAR